MLAQPYSIEELQFAWSFRVYIRSRTYRRQQVGDLAKLDSGQLGELLKPYDIKVLEFNADAVEFRAMLSLKVNETVATAASKLKGRISKWLNTRPGVAAQTRTLGRGYFAVTAGKSTTGAIEAYLESQGRHHGYETRVRPPIFVKSFERTAETGLLLATDHAVTSNRFHIVMATQWRNGVFAESSGAAVTGLWKSLERANRIFVAKVSFLPDHVHIAVELHPTTSPAAVVVLLMNAAQDLMWERFEGAVIQARLSRLWQSGAYVGSYGDWSSSALTAYVRRWEGENFD